VEGDPVELRRPPRTFVDIWPYATNTGTAGSDARDGLSFALWGSTGEEDAEPVVVEVAEAAA
jgi:hypothetical protein